MSFTNEFRLALDAAFINSMTNSGLRQSAIPLGFGISSLVAVLSADPQGNLTAPANLSVIGTVNALGTLNALGNLNVIGTLTAANIIGPSSPITTAINIAALRALPVTSLPVIVQGFAATNDGGGGVFYWDSAGPSGNLDDNQGIVIRSNLDSNGRWRREGFIRITGASHIATAIPWSINAKWFGVIGDGRTDDTAAIQNAINAAFALSDDVFEFQDNQISQGSVGVYLPTGVYLISALASANTGLYIAGRINLMGDGPTATVLKTVDSNIAIIRWGVEFSTIAGISFEGGFCATVLYGTLNGGYIDPTSYGNVPSFLRDVAFNHQRGPAIYQDPGPTAEIAVASNGTVLPVGTINVDSTVEFQTPGQLNVFHADGTQDTVSFTGKTDTTFTGCTGGTRTLHTGDIVSVVSMHRSSQHRLHVENFWLNGPHLFYGIFDFIAFSHGHFAWQLSGAETFDDGLPLGIVNGAGRFDNITGSGGGGAPPRAVMFDVVGSLELSRIELGQDDGICLIRYKVSGNHRYRGLASHSVPMTYILPDASLSGYGALPLKINGLVGVCSFGAYWLEVYDLFPQLIDLKNWFDPSGDFFNTKGIWVEHSCWQSFINSPRYFGYAADPAHLQIDIDMGSLGRLAPGRIWTGFDHGPSVAPVRANATDVTEQLCQNIINKPDNDIVDGFSPNLLRSDIESTHIHFPHEVNSGAVDTSSGFPLHVATATPANGNVNPAVLFFNAMPTSIPAGTYCFSYSIKTNWAAEWSFAAGNNSGFASQSSKRVPQSDGFQRIGYEVHYPGNGQNWSVQLQSISPLPVCVAAWAPSTNYTAGDETQNTYGQRVTLAGNVYVCTQSGISGVSGPAGTGSDIVDGGCLWDYVGPGGAFAPQVTAGLWMLNKGRTPAKYVGPSNADTNTQFGYVPVTYYGIAPPTTGTYRMRDVMVNTSTSDDGIKEWVCSAGGTPGTWKAVHYS